VKKLIILAGALVSLLGASVASAATVNVYAGPPGNGMAKKLLPKSILAVNPDVNAFFPSTVTIHVGDTVNFIRGMMPHTIDLPGPSGEDLPFLVTGGPISGVKDPNGNPFWFNGLPTVLLNPAVLTPIGGHTYNGSARVDSGFYEGNGNAPVFPVKFTKVGTFHYLCDVHYNMAGTVIVRAKSQPIPAGKNSRALDDQLLNDIAVAKQVYKERVPPDTVSVGKSGPGGVELFDMFPSTLTVKAGTVVKFMMSKDTREVHTVTFGTPALRTKLANNLFVSSTLTQEAVYPSDNPALGPIIVSPTHHGDDFANTGALDRDPTTPTIPPSMLVKFATPGTYQYQCLIHPQMQGAIVVK